jgi:superfamily I DNA/RNA helicase
MAIGTIGPQIANSIDHDRRQALIWGPPGCGKTTYLSRQVGHAAAKYGPDRVLVTSFTRAAAAELVGRDLGLPKGQVGTLHSHCYRALNCPTIAETKINEWNDQYQFYRLTPTRIDVDEPDPEIVLKTVGDELYAQMQLLRARMVPTEEWPAPVARFRADWEEWKSEFDYCDFTDLLEIGLRDFKFAPGDPSVVVVDEAQDLTLLQFKLATQWANHADYLLLAADDDQTIYSFAGADPEVLLQHSGEQHFRHVLSQSYRVPRKVRALSELWIQQIVRRENKLYNARPEDGRVRLFHNSNWKEVQAVVTDAEWQVAHGRNIMFLATCSYMLEPLKRALRERGLPFHNPYRRKRMDWNPLERAARGSSVADRVLAFLDPRRPGGYHWNGLQFQLWAGWLRESGVLLPGAKALIEALRPDQEVTIEILRQVLEPTEYRNLLTALNNGSLSDCTRWLIANSEARKRKLFEYPARVVAELGLVGLERPPGIIVGTGHSVKGGEADVVYIFPDLSAAGTRQWNGPRPEKDTVIRLAYVMMTRAREELVICAPAGRSHIPIAPVAVEAGALR